MLFFKKKKEPEGMLDLGRGFVPTDKVKELSAKGFSEPEMIDVLRKDGFSPEEIDKGLTEALKAGVIEEKPAELPRFPPVGRPEVALPELPEKIGAVRKPEELPFLEEIEAPKPKVTEVPEKTLPEEYYYPESYPTEEYIDYVIRERMRDVEQRVTEFSIKYNTLEKRINSIFEQLNLLRKATPGEQRLVTSKIDAFKETMDDIGTRLGSLERAFKETLPALIESVRALSDLAQRLKRET